ncbi:putative quorum-quenching lactonase YtnP [Sporosarcina sp. NCCP-2716]|uniref:YtnP family quorum-quenching lactonase n=1 Tax=Sporosarcina sp. NCCP-2716 TaxID=2943679 RepID=UPI00203F12D5|nr:MBL fold metallo-hydrolase [Sporosarcina sp. NCCP-2716]GKV69535.1 putative quorum-quenching lactonase YtnP [Sporosarcina sp. NCCP-2716]
MDTYTFGSMELTWLDGGVNYLDGGTMFGVVPKAMWSKKYAPVEDNLIELRTDPILIRYKGKNLLVDAGIGKGKLDEKKMRNLGIRAETRVAESLAEIGLAPADIDMVLMTHLHNDHAAGLTEWQDGKLVSVFPNAEIYVSQIEWDEMREPNIRSRNTYFKENWEAVQDQVKTFDKEVSPLPGITMEHTGGHSDGHSIIRLEQDGETMIHMADIMPTHAHSNPLWVLAFDDYPMDSIFAKERLMKEAKEKGHRFFFYHDAVYRVVRFDETGRKVADGLKRTKPE